MNDNSWSPPCVVTLASMEDKVAAAHRVAGNVLAPEANGHRPLLPEDPLLMFKVVGKHWRVVANLDEIHVHALITGSINKVFGGWGGGGWPIIISTLYAPKNYRYTLCVVFTDRKTWYECIHM